MNNLSKNNIRGIFCGYPGESAFTVPFSSISNLKEHNLKIPSFIKRVSETGDDRSFVLLAAIGIEHHCDELLKIIMPEYHSISSRDFTFSLKLKLLKALKLLPPWIIDIGDSIRSLRNDFAHTLEVDKLSDIIGSLDKIRHCYEVAYSGKKPEKDVEGRAMLTDIVTITICALQMYKANLKKLRLTIDDPAFIDKISKECLAETMATFQPSTGK